MPAIGSGGSFRPQAPLPKSKPPPPPPKPRGPSAASVLAATNPVTTRRAPSAAAVQAATVPHTSPAPAKAVMQATNPKPTHVAQAKATERRQAQQRYTQALIRVFNHQSGDQKHAIVQGILAHPQQYESKILLKYLHSAAGVNSAIQAGGLVPDTGGVHLLGNVGKDLSNLIDKIPQIGGTTGSQQVAEEAAGVPTGLDVTKNALKDLVNLPAEAGPSIGIPALEALHGHWGQALNTVIAPYVDYFEHPKKALKHPLDAYLMAMGVLHPVAGAAEGAVRAAIGKPLDRVPESVHLTANLTHERPLKPKSPIARNMGPIPGLPLGYDFLEHARFPKNENGVREPRTANHRSRLIRAGTSRLVGEAERVRAYHHAQQVTSHYDAVLRGRTTPVKFGLLHSARRLERSAHAIRTALKYNPEPALIKGHDVLAHVAERVLRSPKTAVADLEKRIQQVRATRGDLLNPELPPDLLKQHDEYVARMEKAVAEFKKMSPKQFRTLFGVAERHGREYAPIERQANEGGHFAHLNMDAEALKRRTLMASVATHMPGARYDPELGMVRDLANGATHQLSTGRMEQFVRGITGGHMPSFVTHRDLEGDSAHFISTQAEPRAAMEHNTLWAFQHGLTEPGHQALLEQRARMQGIVDAQRGWHRILQTLVIKSDSGEPWSTFKAAVKARDRRPDKKDLVPIRMGKVFHPSDAMKRALQHAQKTGDMAVLEEEAQRRALNIDELTRTPDDVNEAGPWGLIDRQALARLREHENQISLNVGMRAFRGANNQFRAVALGTSFRHLPGVVQETLIRAAMSGVGLMSWVLAHQGFKEAARENPELAERRRIERTGGTVTGQALASMKRSVATHYEGTRLFPVLRAWENAKRAPGPRQATTLWRAYRDFTLGATKHYLEEQAQIAGIGRQIIDEFAGGHGLVALAMGHWGDLIKAAAHGILDEKAARRLAVTNERIWGKWTDLSPHGQMAVMFSPFGMWWLNSMRLLARMPLDHPVLTGALAAANVGTEKQRQKLGLDLFYPGALPLYKQGGIPIGGQLWAANYYSPVGVANDPLETAGQMIEPWAIGPLLALYGDDWHGGTITSPNNPHGDKTPKVTDQIAVILGSLGASFLPLYQKAQTVAEGGASSYDTSTLLNPQTKEPNPGVLAGLKKVFTPLKIGPADQSSSTSNPWGASSSSSSSNPWGVSSSSSSKNPWG